MVALVLWSVAVAFLCAAEGPAVRQPWQVLIPIICFARRRHEIGGWLLLFHIANYSGLLTSLMFMSVGSENYLPQTWGGQDFLYAAFLFQVIPGVLLLVCVLVLAEKLRLSRDARWLVPLRTALWLNGAHAVAVVVVELIWFEVDASMALNVVAVFSSTVWALYFAFSKRVHSVYIARDWPRPR
jgi:hypothetical protein